MVEGTVHTNPTMHLDKSISFPAKVGTVDASPGVPFLPIYFKNSQ